MSYTILGEPDMARTAVINSIDPGLTTLSDGSYETSTSGTSGSSSSSSSSSSDTAVYYYARAAVDNGDAHLHIGMTAQASITTATRKGVTLVPLLAVESAPGGRQVRVLEADGAVRPRPVTTGLSDGVRVEIRSGLREGEKVVSGELTQAQVEASEQRHGPGPRAALMPLIAVERVSKWYGVEPNRVQVLHEVSFTIERASLSPSWGLPVPANPRS